MVLRLVGLGLGPPEYLTLKSVKALEESDVVYLDTYTSPVPPELLDFLRPKLGERLRLAGRHELEEGVHLIMEKAAASRIAVAALGDPLIATTHITLLIEAASRGIDFEIIYGVSSISAAIAVSGLSSYRFGRTVTIPKEATSDSLKTIYRSIEENLEYGLHTLVLLDVADGGLLASEAIEKLLNVGEAVGGRFGPESMVIVLARLGYGDEFKAACRAAQVKNLQPPPPPHIVIIPAQLRSYEKEAVKMLMRVDEELLETQRLTSSRRARAERYLTKASKALSILKKTSDDPQTAKVLELATSYLDDAKFFLNSQMIDDSLIAVSYAEGLLDSLRILGKVEFTW